MIDQDHHLVRGIAANTNLHADGHAGDWSMHIRGLQSVGSEVIQQSLVQPCPHMVILPLPAGQVSSAGLSSSQPLALP